MHGGSGGGERVGRGSGRSFAQRSFSSSSSRDGHHSSRSPQQHQQHQHQQRDSYHYAYSNNGGGASSSSAVDADPVADRQRDRKARRRQERRDKKQARIAQQETWAQERQQARAAALERKSAAIEERQRKRQRRERAVETAQEKVNKRRKSETSSRGTSGRSVRATAEAATSAQPPAATRKSLSSPSRARLHPTQPSAAAAATAEQAPVPAEVTEKVRRLVNKLTTSNVVDLTKDLSDYMLEPGVSRASVMQGLAQQMERLCRLEAGPLSTTGTLPFAGLLRGVQLLHGNQVGAELVERVSLALHAQLAAAEEAAAVNTLTVLAQLYLLYGVDVVYVISLLRTLLRQGTRLLDRGDASAASPSPAVPAASSAVAAQAGCAAACGLALMRACGEKLLKESPAELEASLQEARRASAAMRHVTGTARFAALVEVMGEIAAGRSRRARRTTTEEAAPVEAMLEDLCSLLPGHEKATASQRRTMRRLVLTTNIVSGLTWGQVTTAVKPPRWYVPGVMATDGTDGSDGDLDEDEEEDEEEEEAAVGTPFASDDESEVDEAERKREAIARMRTEEKALSGQRLNTEHKREIFKCVATATDDLECFTMLMYRDPGYTRFHDTCAVLLQCAYQERQYNAYYVQVLLRFCSAKPACVKTLQFAIWDRLKSIRIEGTDIAGYFNFACCIADLIESGVYNLSLLRGLDLENTNKTIGLFTRVLLLRLIFQLPAPRLTQLFFGGDGRSAHDLQVDTSALRRLLTTFMSLYFVDENASKRWLPSFYDVVAAGTSFDVSATAAPSHVLGARGAGGVGAAEEQLLRRNADRPTSTLTADAAVVSPAALAHRESSASTPEQFMKRVQVVYKALKQGIS
ncbi:MA3 domain containing protein [Novymonas esmeraldas]|uniref:MA3 domain containing protein n=1 Tax=Novymonas esmeraldas TaxID=1808958 RepID=A0AAW0ELS7_9TRYP